RALSMCPSLISYPGMCFGVENGLAPHPGSSAMLWLCWHAELGAAILCYALLRSFPNDSPKATGAGRIAIWSLIAVALAITAVAMGATLPAANAGGHWAVPFIASG